jgi:hypothetical protein
MSDTQQSDLMFDNEDKDTNINDPHDTESESSDSELEGGKITNLLALNNN